MPPTLGHRIRGDIAVPLSRAVDPSAYNPRPRRLHRRHQIDRFVLNAVRLEINRKRSLYPRRRSRHQTVHWLLQPSCGRQPAHRVIGIAFGNCHRSRPPPDASPFADRPIRRACCKRLTAKSGDDARRQGNSPMPELRISSIASVISRPRQRLMAARCIGTA